MRATDFKTARKQLGLTQTEMGERLGLTKRQVRNLETGVTPIRHAYAMLTLAALRSDDSAPGASGHEKKDRTE